MARTRTAVVPAVLKPNIPKTPGEAIDMLFDLRAMRMELDQQAKALREKESVISDLIHQMLKKNGLDRASGSKATFTITNKTEPNVVNWELFHAWVSRTKAWECLQKRVGSTAIKERWQQGKEIPGVEAKEIIDYSLTKR